MNTKSMQIWGLIWAVVMLAYGIYLVMYLHNAGKYTSQMSQKDQNFRKVALVVTWIQVILSGLMGLGLLIALLSGDSSVYSPMGSLPTGASMGWF